MSRPGLTTAWQPGEHEGGGRGRTIIPCPLRVRMPPAPMQKLKEQPCKEAIAQPFHSTTLGNILAKRLLHNSPTQLLKKHVCNKHHIPTQGLRKQLCTPACARQSFPKAAATALQSNFSTTVHFKSRRDSMASQCFCKTRGQNLEKPFCETASA